MTSDDLEQYSEDCFKLIEILAWKHNSGRYQIDKAIVHLAVESGKDANQTPLFSTIIYPYSQQNVDIMKMHLQQCIESHMQAKPFESVKVRITLLGDPSLDENGTEFECQRAELTLKGFKNEPAELLRTIHKEKILKTNTVSMGAFAHLHLIHAVAGKWKIIKEPTDAV